MSARALVLLLTVGVAMPAAGGQWPTYAGGPHRLFFNPARSPITAANVQGLKLKWSFPTGAIVTASPSVATLRVPGKGREQVAFIQSWDHTLYAVRTGDGSEFWRFPMPDQPGAPYPDTASADVRSVDGRMRVFIASGENVYCVDALTGQEVWRFSAGTGCPNPPGVCAFNGEQNEVESSPIVADGKVFFGMDVNEGPGRGGFYAVDARDGRLAWYFDLETGATCRARRSDDVRHFDGYHSEAELGLPQGFLASRPGCSFDRSSRDGGGAAWSSASIDAGRKLLFFTTGASGEIPNTAPYEEAIVALHFDGTPAWHWRPRPIDPNDLDFGAVPNLFTIKVGRRRRDVVGVGGKDGTYYVLDREGMNVANRVRWDDADASGLPYWRRQVVPGGSAGGIIATAAVDQKSRRVYFSTAQGSDADVLTPQRPTVHALDLDTGAVVWENTTEPAADASFASTSAIPGLVFVGKNVGGVLRVYDAATGAKLASVPVAFTLASAPAIVDGLVILGGGSGTRSDDPGDIANVTAKVPVSVKAFCVAGTEGCN
jgi:outer membrane protein assembly factor BamB